MLTCFAGAEELSVVITIFPESEWARESLGERSDAVGLTMLADTGVDLHSFQPSYDDQIAVASCDLFVYTGGESDEWVEDAIASSGGDGIYLNLIESLGDSVLKETPLEGMEEEDADESESDEHIWLSISRAKESCECICDALCEIDPDYADVYRANLESYLDKLDALDESYAQVISNAKNDTLLFGDRFPFAYLAGDYNLTCYAAFSGCSAETEASFETDAYLAGTVDELDLKYVMVLEGSDQSIAETIISSTQDQDAEILTINSMQSVTLADAEAGQTYLAIMEENLAVLQTALN